MSKQILKSNTVANSIAAACAIFGVRCYRMNSRVFPVIGQGGISRPMFMGQWTDRFGQPHFKGMADLLLTPILSVSDGRRIAAAVWVECKSGTGKLTADQDLFREDVEEAGAFYLCAHDGPDLVIEFFEENGVRR